MKDRSLPRILMIQGSFWNFLTLCKKSWLCELLSVLRSGLESGGWRGPLMGVFGLCLGGQDVPFEATSGFVHVFASFCSWPAGWPVFSVDWEGAAACCRVMQQCTSEPSVYMCKGHPLWHPAQVPIRYLSGHILFPCPGGSSHPFPLRRLVLALRPW